jgi:hypothetical protein
VLAARDPEWFEKIDKLTPADMVALAEEFTKQQVAKVQHGELLRVLCWGAGCLVSQLQQKREVLG